VNCPLAVTHSAVLFVVRTLLPDDVPMNAGVAARGACERAAGLPRQRALAQRGGGG